MLAATTDLKSFSGDRSRATRLFVLGLSLAFIPVNNKTTADHQETPD